MAYRYDCDLQTRLAYQEQTLHELNDVLISQQKHLRELEIASVT